MPPDAKNSLKAPNFSPKLYSLAALVAVIIAAGLWLVIRFTAADLARDMQTWQEKLNLIAESRTAEVGGWVSNHFKSLRALAGNPSLQLYLGELQAGEGGEKSPLAVEPAQKSYLRNVLVFTAEQLEFKPLENSAIVNANVPQPSRGGGLAVITGKSQLVVSTAMSQATATAIAAQAKNLPAGRESLIDLYKDNDGVAYIGFSVPIFPIQGEHDAASQIGRIIGLKAVDDNLFALLKHPGVTEKTLESILVRADGGKIDYLSPLQDGAAALEKQAEFQPGQSAESSLIETVGDFSGSLKDYRGQPVLATSRAVPGTPWKLIVKIDRGEALAESTKQRAGMVVMFLLIIVIVALTVAVVWWHAHSERAMMMSRHFRKLAAKTFAHEQLLQLVTDHQPESIYIVDAEGSYHFANRKAASDAGMTPEFVLGKSLQDVRGAGRAEYIRANCKEALINKRTLYDTAEEGNAVIRSAFVPLESIPVAALQSRTPGVLVVEQDISEVVRERERRLGTQTHLVDMLVKLVDKRDPFSADHSALVSQVAYKIAVDMGLAPQLAETARTAGSLMNIGKIVVPAELLTKTGALSREEKHAIQESMQAAADLVKNIHFDGPVAETLRQWQERWDGKGLLGLRGEAILAPARIIAAANAFVGMISPRSWRTAIPIESAAKFLLDQSDSHFDRRVVISLVNHIENHNGRAWLEKILQEHRNAT